MQDVKRLPDSELEIMKVLWQQPSAMTRRQIQAQLAAKGWAVGTFQALLARLEAKGFAAHEKVGNTVPYPNCLTFIFSQPIIQVKTAAAAAKKEEHPMAFEIFPWGPMRRRAGERDQRAALQDIRDCGFTASGFLEPEDIPLCREVGLEPITFLFSDQPGEVDENMESPFTTSRDGRLNITCLAKNKQATPEMIDTAMRQALAHVPAGPAKVYIVDEPGTTWMPRIQQMIECVRKYRPDLTPYVNLFPNYAVCGDPDISQLEAASFEEYLDAYCRTCPDMPVSIDNYLVTITGDFAEEGGEARYYQNYVQVREACDKYGVDFHHITGCVQLRHWQAVPTFENLLLQANTSLAAGARSVSWFSYYARGGYLYAPIDDNTDQDVHTPTWYLLREVNRRLLAMGNVLSHMPYEGLYFTHPGDIPRAHSVAECAAITHFESDERCVVGLYRDGDSPVAVVVNGSLERSTRVEVLLDGKQPQVFNVEQECFREPLLTNTHGQCSALWLAPGDAVILRG